MSRKITTSGDTTPETPPKIGLCRRRRLHFSQQSPKPRLFLQLSNRHTLALMASKKTLSQQLREAIIESGISRYEISKQTGVSQSALSRFVLGERGISVKAMDAIGLFLGLSVISRGRRDGGKHHS